MDSHETSYPSPSVCHPRNPCLKLCDAYTSPRKYPSNLPYSEILWIAPGEILQIKLDFAQILLQFACGSQFLFAGDKFLLVVNANDDNGHSSLKGDVVEPLLPIGIGLSGAFRSDGQMKDLTLVARLHHLLYQRVALAAMHGHTAHRTEEYAQRPEEPLLLHHELCLPADGRIKQLAIEKIPIAGVRATADDILGVIRHCDTRLPP